MPPKPQTRGRENQKRTSGGAPRRSLSAGSSAVKIKSRNSSHHSVENLIAAMKRGRGPWDVRARRFLSENLAFEVNSHPDTLAARRSFTEAKQKTILAESANPPSREGLKQAVADEKAAGATVREVYVRLVGELMKRQTFLVPDRGCQSPPEQSSSNEVEMIEEFSDAPEDISSPRVQTPAMKKRRIDQVASDDDTDSEETNIDLSMAEAEEIDLPPDVEAQVLLGIRDEETTAALLAVDDEPTANASTKIWTAVRQGALATEARIRNMRKEMAAMKSRIADNEEAIQDVTDHQDIQDGRIDRLCSKVATLEKAPGMSAELIKKMVDSAVDAKLGAMRQNPPAPVPSVAAFSEVNYLIAKKQDYTANEQMHDTVLLLGVPMIDEKGDDTDDCAAATSILHQFGVDADVVKDIVSTERKGETSDQHRPLLVRFNDKAAATKIVRGRFGVKAAFGGSTNVTVKYNKTPWLREAYRKMFTILDHLKRVRPELNAQNRFGVAVIDGWRFEAREFHRPVLWLKGELLNVGKMLEDCNFKFM